MIQHDKTTGPTSNLFSYVTTVAGYDDKGACRTKKSKCIDKNFGAKNEGREVEKLYIERLAAQ